MADISSITLPGGGTYDLKDKNAVPKYGMGENLLDNADFRNPINQRGASSYTATGNSNYYSIDRWYLYGASRSLTIGTGYVTITPPSGATATLTQRPQLRYSDVAGMQLTISALLSSGELLEATNTLPATAPSSNTSLISAYSTVSGFIRLGYNNGFYFLFQTGTGTSLSVIKAKLELGTEQTLCHNEGTAEAPVWVLNEIPDYEYELYRCITSTADPADIYANKVISTNISKPNLLRNWYWKNPINQRGENSYTFTSASYGIDAWKMNRGTITITSSGLVCTWNGSTTYQTNIQNIQNYGEIAGKTITMSALSSDGTLYKDTFTVVSSGSYVTSSGTVRFAASAKSQALGVNISSTTGITIVAVKAELGTEQTLAHQENGVWVLNEIPDYEYELYRCITSTADSTDTYANKSLATREDLTNIQVTGTTNTTGTAIPAGAYFYLNGVLHRAKTQIAVNATFTVNTNCEQVTAGGLNALSVRSYTNISFNTTYVDISDPSLTIHVSKGGGMSFLTGTLILKSNVAAGVQLGQNFPLPVETNAFILIVGNSSKKVTMIRVLNYGSYSRQLLTTTAISIADDTAWRVSGFYLTSD